MPDHTIASLPVKRRVLLFFPFGDLKPASRHVFLQLPFICKKL